MARRLQGERIGGEGLRAAAMDLARELVEDEDARQAGARLVEPVAMRAGGEKRLRSSASKPASFANQRLWRLP
jgi:hypothetical protein